MKKKRDKLTDEWCEGHEFEYFDEAATMKNEKETILSKGLLAWEEVSTKHIVNNEWIDFKSSMYRFPDGKIRGPFYSYSRRDYVVILALDAEGNYLCVRQFRQGIHAVTTEFPAGRVEKLEHGRDAQTTVVLEDALDTAKRELQEETGYTSDEWEHLCTLPSSATMCDNYAWIYIAKNCRSVSNQNLDDTEFLHVVKHSPKEIEDLILKGEFQQIMHVTAYLLYKDKRK